MILLTGSNGNVGSYLVRHLVEMGEEVRAMTHYNTNNLEGMGGFILTTTPSTRSTELG